MAIARALIPEPAVTFADEPTGALDLHVAAEVLELLRETAPRQTFVMVTHDPVAASYAQRVVFLADGRIVDELADADRRPRRRDPHGAARMPRLRHRRAALFATLVAVALGAALASACGGLFETALRLDAPPSPRLAAYDAVIAPAEHAALAAGDGKPAQQVTLVERGHLPAGTLERVQVPGVESGPSDLADRGDAIGGPRLDVGVPPHRWSGSGRDPSSPATIAAARRRSAWPARGSSSCCCRASSAGWR